MVGAPHLLTPVVADAGDVTHQLARCDLPLLVRETRQVALHRHVQVEATTLIEQADGRRSHRLRRAADSEPRERRHGDTFLDVCPAEPFGPHQLVVDRDSYR